MDNQSSKLIEDSAQGVVMLNSAATTPPFMSTTEAVTAFLKTYGAFHRGAGPRANLTYQNTQAAIHTIKEFIGLPETHELVFTPNTSGAISLFARLLGLRPDDVVLTSEIEHTSNNLPWLFNTEARVEYVRAFDDGSVDYEDLETKAALHVGKLRLIAMTGAASLSGYVPGLDRITKIAKAYNALLFIDAAQLAPHRQITMQEQGIDALAFSAHKIYAPFGVGVLALPGSILDSAPVDPGGGSIDMISDRGVIWSSPSARHQTGTWNVTGIVALGASCQEIMHRGWPAITKHERALVSYLAEKLPTVPNIELYFDQKKYIQENRIGTFVFNLKGYHHALVSAILEHEYGIETRAGTICNHKLVRRWLKVSDVDQVRVEEEIRKGNRLASYGIVRASLGMHNTKEDIDALIAALTAISTNGPRLRYKPLPEEEIYVINA